MKVISEGCGLALVFDNPADLDRIIEQLTELRLERMAAPTKSWPALLGVYVTTAPKVKENKARLRWLRYALRLGTFSD